MLPHWIKWPGSAGLGLALLLVGCVGQPVRNADTPQADAEKPTAQPQQLPRDYENALVLMQSGDYQAAIPVLQSFIEKHPDRAGPYVNLGIAQQRSGQPDAALQSFAKAVERNPASAAAYHQMGILYREQGKFEDALNAYRQALQLDDSYALAHRNIGILYDLYLQRPNLAMEHYHRYLELAQQPDQQVSRWLVDLERRSGTATARTAQ